MSKAIDRGSFSPDDISPWFWEIVEKCERDRNQLRSVLEDMSRDEIIRFDNEFQDAAVQLVDEPFFEFMDEGISEDSAKDVADFVVSQGKGSYASVWEHPDQIPTYIRMGEQKTFSGVASKVFWERFGGKIPSKNEGHRT